MNTEKLERRRKKHIAVLEKRLNHLLGRIREAEEGGVELSFDRSEAAALRWALSEVDG